MPRTYARMVPIADLENPLEADLLSALLEELCVAHRIRSFADSAYGHIPIFEGRGAWGRVYAEESRRDIIHRTLESIRRKHEER